MSRQRFIDVAKGYIGANYEHFCSAFGVGCTPWCAACVAVIGKESGVDIPWSMSCTAQRNEWIRRGRWFTDRNYEVGDVIYYDWDRSGDCDHVGIITSIQDGYLYVTEGNFGDYDNDVTRVTIRKVNPNWNLIAGYAKPVFNTSVDTSNNTVTKTEEAKPKKFVDVSIAQIEKGLSGKIVKTLQTLLIMNGYDCGSYGADGKFGACTEDAVMKYQEDNSLDVDGIVGIATWGSLLS